MFLLYSENIEQELFNFLKNRAEKQIFLLTDFNTERCCLPVFSNLVEEFGVEIFTMPVGEEHKTMDTVQDVLDFLMKNKADRKSSLLINLGGGVVTDLGGLVASLYKRGITFINIPTTVLAMVDAAIGGKNGVNFGGFKNQIGTFGTPEIIAIYPEFMRTLSEREFFNGVAEMFKHALLAGEQYWDDLKEELNVIKNSEFRLSVELLRKNTAVKMRYVEQDPMDKGIRAALNFGHTFGHAFETAYSFGNKQLKHGEAVAAGMICEAFISHKVKELPLKISLKITQDISKYYPVLSDVKQYRKVMLEAMKYDKKNIDGKIRCVLIENWAKPTDTVEIDFKLIDEALNFYLQL